MRRTRPGPAVRRVVRRRAAVPHWGPDPACIGKAWNTTTQKVFPVNVIRDFVPGALFDIVGIWDDFSLKKHTPHSERVHFLLRKKGGP